MGYKLGTTPGDNAYLEGEGTFPQIVDGGRAIALKRDAIDAALRKQTADGDKANADALSSAVTSMNAAWKKGDTDTLSTAKDYADTQDQALLDRIGFVEIDPSTGYTHVLLDAQRHIALAVTTEGKILAPGGIESPAVSVQLDPASGYGFAVTDPEGHVGELAMAPDGSVPQWVLDRWAQRMNLPEPAGPDVPEGNRPALASAFVSRRGGRIGTGGKPVVALRFDHGLTAFKSKVLPLLRERGLPSMNTMNARTWGQASNSGMSAAELQAAWINDGVEVTNHAATHNDAATDEAVYDEIVNGLTQLQASFPSSVIEGYCPPGVDGTRFQGFEGGKTTAQWTDTLAGRLIAQYHAACFGYWGSIYRPQGVDLQIGAAHTTIDAQTPEWVSGVVRGLVAAGPCAMTLMLHPVYLDQAGYMTTEGLTAVLDDIAARRDAGEIIVTTPTGSLVLDPSTTYRHDLISNPSFSGATVGTLTAPPSWSGSWYVRSSASGVTELSAGGVTAVLSQGVGLSRLGHLRGGNREFVVTARALSGTDEQVKLTVSDGGALNTSKTFTLGATAKKCRVPFSIPTDGGATVTFSIQRTGGTGTGIAVSHATAPTI